MMASAKELHEFIVEQLQDLEGFSFIPMMGGCIYYLNGKIFGGLYGTGFMAKITDASKAFMPDSKPMPPYDGAKDMLPVTILEDKKKLKEMIQAMYDELPAPKPKKPKTSITTKRLKIVALKKAELKEAVEKEEDPIMKMALGEMLEGVEKQLKAWMWYTQWLISIKKGPVIGSLGFKGLVNKREVEIGYGIDEAYQKQGYATEAVEAAIKRAFAADQDVQFVMAETELDNEASKRVLHKLGLIKCGMGEGGTRFENVDQKMKAFFKEKKLLGMEQ